MVNLGEAVTSFRVQSGASVCAFLLKIWVIGTLQKFTEMHIQGLCTFCVHLVCQ